MRLLVAVSILGFIGTAAQTTPLIAADESSSRSSTQARADFDFARHAYTDPDLSSGVPIKAAHFTELRSAINTTRATLGWAPISFTDPLLLGTAVKRAHLLELRGGIDGVRAKVNIPQYSYSDPTITAGASIVRAAHVLELRNSLQFGAVPSVPPGSYRIVFSQQACNTNCDMLWSMNSDGSGRQQLTSSTDRQDLQPSWSPDRSRIAFSSNRERDTGIYIMYAYGSPPVRVQNGSDYSTWPAWSPDGKRIAFVGRFGDEIGIATMNIDGTDVNQLTHEPCPGGFCTIPGRPSWSPDGTRIAFDTPRDGNFEVYVMNSDGSEQRNISNRAASTEGNPAWSPDGSRIAFTSDRNGISAIFVMNVDGTDQRQLTFPTVPPGIEPWNGGETCPSWSTDGRTIAFHGRRASGNLLESGIWVVDVATGQTTKIAGTASFYPAWAN